MSWSHSGFAKVARIVSEHSGLTFPAERRPYTEAAIRRAMAAARANDFQAYAAELCANAALLGALLGEITVGETYFFRDPAQFAVLRKTVIPELCARSSLRFWSAGCASGEEAYSLAMLAEEFALQDRCAITGTDISPHAIERARQGVYGDWSFRAQPVPWRGGCFTERSGKWHIAARFRERVAFSVANLSHAEAGQPTDVDVIFCRNVLMYFDSGALQRAARALADALRPGGWLFTSPADPMLPPESGLEVISTPAGLVYRKSAGVQKAPIAVAFPAPLSPKPPVLRPAHASPPAPPYRAPEPTPVREARAERQRLDAEPHVLSALLLLELGDPQAAAAAARRALYLDRTLAIAELALGRALRLLGNRRGASRALRRAHELLAGVPDDATVRFSQNSLAGNLAANAAAELVLLQQSVRESA